MGNINMNQTLILTFQIFMSKISVFLLATGHATTPKCALSKFKLRFTSPSIDGLPHRGARHQSRWAQLNLRFGSP